MLEIQILSPTRADWVKPWGVDKPGMLALGNHWLRGEASIETLKILTTKLLCPWLYSLYQWVLLLFIRMG